LKNQRLAILGSTGSIGTQALDIVRQHGDFYDVEVLTGNTNWELLARQIEECNPSYALICDEVAYKELKKLKTSTEIILGAEKLAELVKLDTVDTVLNSLVGFVGFEPTCEAVKAGKKVALANKESLVVGGELIIRELKKSGTELIPVDSEHSAMLQCLTGESHKNIEKIIITASGGPFREYNREQLRSVTVEDALKHPNWEMGAKITIDSSTMMNKGLEIIEAYWLFDIELDQIEPVIHPQSIIHSIVTFKDGSSKAQLGPPDMKVPIIYALTYPDRINLDVPRLDWSAQQELTFYPVNYELFPCVMLAMQAIKMGGSSPAVLNAANEVAVQRFLNKEIGYIDISETVRKSLGKFESVPAESVLQLKEIDKETRKFAAQVN